MNLNFFRKYDQDIHFTIQIVIIFIGILFIIAMWIYPDDYSFFDNFLSDLGRIRTKPSLNPNPVSSIVFTKAMTLGGIALFFFFLFSRLPYKLIQTKQSKETEQTKETNENIHELWLNIGILCGLFSSPFMILIGWFPLDTMEMYHHVATIVFFIAIVFAIISYSIFFFLNTDVNDRKLLVVLTVLMLSIAVILIYLKEISPDFAFYRIIGSGLFIIILGIILIFTILLRFREASLKTALDYEKHVNALSIIVSVYILSVFLTTILFVYINGEFRPVYEILVIWSILLWAIVNNYRALILSYRTQPDLFQKK